MGCWRFPKTECFSSFNCFSNRKSSSQYFKLDFVAVVETKLFNSFYCKRFSNHFAKRSFLPRRTQELLHNKHRKVSLRRRENRYFSTARLPQYFSSDFLSSHLKLCRKLLEWLSALPHNKSNLCQLEKTFWSLSTKSSRVIRVKRSATIWIANSAKCDSLHCLNTSLCFGFWP